MHLKKVVASFALGTWIIWLTDGSVSQYGIVRAILLPRFGQSTIKNGLWFGVGGGWGGGGGTTLNKLPGGEGSS